MSNLYSLDFVFPDDIEPSWTSVNFDRSADDPDIWFLHRSEIWQKILFFYWIGNKIPLTSLASCKEKVHSIYFKVSNGFAMVKKNLLTSKVENKKVILWE